MRSRRVQLIAKPDLGMTGTSRYAAELYRGLREAGVDVCLTFPDPPMLPSHVMQGTRRLGLDLQAFFASHPLRTHLDHANVYHITTQTMATLLWFQRFHAPVLVTVLDIIPYLVRHDRDLYTSRHVVDRLFYRLALAGLRRADALIAISEYTKGTLVRALDLPPERIHVVYPVVDHERFRPLDVTHAFWAKYGLKKDCKYVLFVGSDDPRKGLRTLVQSFAVVKRQMSKVRLLKVGAPHFAQERQRLLALASDLGIREDVLFFDNVPDDDLPSFYNVADVFVMPSLYEGFCLPVAEAMACGVPVVCSRETALPEVVGTSALFVDHSKPEGLAVVLERAMNDEALAASLRREGPQRAAMFTARHAVDGVLKAYAVTAT